MMPVARLVSSPLYYYCYYYCCYYCYCYYYYYYYCCCYYCRRSFRPSGSSSRSRRPLQLLQQARLQVTGWWVGPQV
jgi:hypothetical protein